MSATQPILRPATAADVPAITEILNDYVQHSTCIWQCEPFSAADRQAWFAQHDARYPIIVAELDRRIIGWGSLSPFSMRDAWAHTVEDSVYVQRDFARRGLGRLILQELIALGKKHQHHLIVAVISADQTPSLKLHESLGFTFAGKLIGAGFKFGKWLDAVYLEKTL